MARQCTVCARPDVQQLNHLLLTGTPLARLARDFGIPKANLQRHWANHVASRTPNLPANAGKWGTGKAARRTQTVITASDRERTEVALADLQQWEPRQYFHRQLLRVERIAEQAEAEEAHALTLNAVESSRRLYGDALHLFAEPYAADKTDASLLQKLDQIATEPEEREVLGRLLLKLQDKDL